MNHSENPLAPPMTVSQAIDRLTRLQKSYGDLPVILADRDVCLRSIEALNDRGDARGPRIEIGLRGW